MLPLGMFFLTLSACQEDPTLTYHDSFAAERANIIKQPTNAQVAYHYKYLETLAKGILYQSQNQTFRDIVYNKVAEEFDGETNALIEKIADAYGREKLMTEIQASFKSHGLSEVFENGLRAFDFTGINGQKRYPQIYIHEFDAKVISEINGRMAGKSVPVVAIKDLEEETEAIPGYTLNEKGDVVLMDELITEEYAKNHEVWVISINERVSSDEQIAAKLKEKSQPQARVQPCALSAQALAGNCNDGRIPVPTQPPLIPIASEIPDAGIEVRCRSLRITSHKESWYRGGSEVGIATTATTGAPGAS